MAQVLGRLVLLLAIVLAIGNGQCSAQCSLEVHEHQSTSCHSHGQTSRCVQQHDLDAAAAHFDLPPMVSAGPVAVLAPALVQIAGERIAFAVFQVDRTAQNLPIRI